MIHNHISDALKKPDIIKLTNNLYIARFESMKIYSALYAVRSLLQRGIINKETTLIDSSSGIYAHALAMACHKYRLKCHIIASKTIDVSTKIQLKLLGAYVEDVPSAGTLKLDQNYRVEKIEKIIKENPNYHWMQQYHDDIHCNGYEEFADMIVDEIGCEHLSLVGGVGSGCSTGAIGNYLRQKGIHVNLFGIQPFGSITFGAENIEDPEIMIAGIGSAIEFRNVKYESYNTIDWLSFDYCMSGTIELMKKYAIFAGLSSGASYCVGQYEAKQKTDIPCLIIAADTGHRYVDAVFSRHEDAHPLDDLMPTLINQAHELTPPWSRYQWDRHNKNHLSQFTSND